MEGVDPPASRLTGAFVVINNREGAWSKEIGSVNRLNVRPQSVKFRQNKGGASA